MESTILPAKLSILFALIAIYFSMHWSVTFFSVIRTHNKAMCIMYKYLIWCLKSSQKIVCNMSQSHPASKHYSSLSPFCLSVSLCLSISLFPLSPFLLPLLWLRRLPQELKIPGSNPTCGRIFWGRSSHTSDLKIGTPVATLPGAWCYRVSAGTGWPSVSVLWVGEMESWICNFCLSVAACKIVWSDLPLRYTGMFLGC